MVASIVHKPIRIHDTIHGYITLPWEYAVRFVDTPQFQRLRRIEQSAVRALYPTARHDRFTHSLGVYHVGCLIVEHFKEEKNASYLEKYKNIYVRLFEKYPEIVESYKIACLLHDVGHAPFSHTLEEYFGAKDIRKLYEGLQDSLQGIIQDDELGWFEKDYLAATRENEKNIPKPHEFSSAIVCVKCFGEAIKQTHAYIDYVVRMILGVKYRDASDDKEQLANVFIELLHGETIDADRLDYACRDTWASGYCTSTVDMRRLIYAMHIRETNKGVVLCYNDKVINEIESLLNVKDFQVKYIFNHHVIRYDQYLLDMAARTMASEYIDPEVLDTDGEELTPEGLQNKALSKFISVDALTMKDCEYMLEPNKPEKNPHPPFNIANIADEDILFLMKQTDNPYYKEWASRQYKYYPLWKTRDEYHAIFPDSIGRKAPNNTVFKNTILSALNKLDDPKCIIILQVKYKGKTPLVNLKLWSNERVVDYNDLYPAEEPISHSRQDETIFYVYYKSEYGKEQQDLRESERKRLLELLAGPVNAFYRNELR